MNLTESPYPQPEAGTLPETDTPPEAITQPEAVTQPETITQPEPLLSLLGQQLRRGVFTNLTLSADDWRQELADAPVTAWSWPDGLLLFRERDGKRLVGYYLHPPYTLPVWHLPGTFVVEVPTRPRDTGKPNPVVRLFQQAGFAVVLQRIRLSRTAPDQPPVPKDAGQAAPLVRAATVADFPAVRALLQAQYSSLTGCLPTQLALLRDIQAGRIGIVMLPRTGQETGGELVSLLHFAAQAKAAEIRHICTHPAFRRQGYAQAVLDWFHTQGTTIPFGASVWRVWTEPDNQPARRLYEANGYRPDGWTACVLARKGGQKER